MTGKETTHFLKGEYTVQETAEGLGRKKIAG
jgi:hypothetical protein